VGGWLASPDRTILLAEDGGVACGLAALVVRDRLGWSTPEAWLSDLVVRGRARRTGVGSTLVRACLELARSQGCRLLRLECGLDRTDAQSFYASLGFERSGLDLRLAIR
jgi:GNAT superfamily N-acetyltransferase